MRRIQLNPLTVLCSLLLTAIGCEVPGQIFFSPDGKQAAYMQEGRSVLIDEQGKILRPLGDSVGGFAWSADSATLYFATQGPAAADQPNMPVTQPTDGKAAVNMLRDQTVTPLFTLPGDSVLYLALSPDQKWLAAVSRVKQDDRTQLQLYAYQLEARSLHELSLSCGLGICFTGPARLAYIQPDSDVATELEHATGKLMEIKLDEIPAPPAEAEAAARPLLNVIPGETAWMVALGDEIYFTARQRTFPARATSAETSKSYQLFHFSRADGAVTPIIEQAGPLFAISPDGKRLLYQAIEPATEQRPAQSNLVVANLNGSDGRVLCPLPQLPPMWPAWRTAGEIAYVDFSHTDRSALVRNGKRYFDVILYRIDDAHRLQPVRTLSESWPVELKPYMNVETATQSTESP